MNISPLGHDLLLFFLGSQSPRRPGCEHLYLKDWHFVQACKTAQTEVPPVSASWFALVLWVPGTRLGTGLGTLNGWLMENGG